MRGVLLVCAVFASTCGTARAAPALRAVTSYGGDGVVMLRDAATGSDVDAARVQALTNGGVVIDTDNGRLIILDRRGRRVATSSQYARVSLIARNQGFFTVSSRWDDFEHREVAVVAAFTAGGHPDLAWGNLALAWVPGATSHAVPDGAGGVWLLGSGGDDFGPARSPVHITAAGTVLSAPGSTPLRQAAGAADGTGLFVITSFVGHGVKFARLLRYTAGGAVDPAWPEADVSDDASAVIADRRGGALVLERPARTIRRYVLGRPAAFADGATTRKVGDFGPVVVPDRRGGMLDGHTSAAGTPYVVRISHDGRRVSPVVRLRRVGDVSRLEGLSVAADGTVYAVGHAYRRVRLGRGQIGLSSFAAVVWKLRRG